MELKEVLAGRVPDMVYLLGNPFNGIESWGGAEQPQAWWYSLVESIQWN